MNSSGRRRKAKFCTTTTPACACCVWCRALGKGGDKVGLKVVYKKHAVLFGRSNVHDPNIERSSSRSFLTELVHERFLDGEPNGQAIRADLDLFLKATCELGGSHRFSPVDDQMRPPSRNSANLSGVDE